MQHEDDLGELLEALDMESYLDSQGLDYRNTRGRSGPQLNVKVCPLCGNSDSKVYLNQENGLGNCFAGSHPAGERFNKWSFIRAHVSGVSGAEVVAHIRAHVSARGWTPKRVKSVKTDAPVQLVMPESFELPQGERNIKYLTNRGITNDITKLFHLRYCHQGFFPFMHEGEWRRMDFSQRVLIPVFDLNGTMVTFQGRDITGTKEKKYLFPPGLASTGTHVLNGMNVRNTKRIAVGEGGFDIMALKMGLDLVPELRDVIPVGTFGKHLSYGAGDTQEAKFLELKDRGVEEVTMFWDGEIQATDDAVEAGLRLRGWGFKVRVAMLPKNKDPNEVSSAVIAKCFYEAIPLSMQSAVQIQMRRRMMNA